MSHATCVCVTLLYSKMLCGQSIPHSTPQIVITQHNLFIEPICNTSPISIATIGYYNIGYQKCLGDSGTNYIYFLNAEIFINLFFSQKKL